MSEIDEAYRRDVERMADREVHHGAKEPQQWTERDLNNAMSYGVCLVCMTPQEMETVSTYVGEQLVVSRSLIRPCGHTEGEIDRELNSGA